MASGPKSRQKPSTVNPFRVRANGDGAAALDPLVHTFGEHRICDTERRGHATPRGMSPLEIVVDATEGFVPLWAADTVLRWRFRERSLSHFENSAAAKAEIRTLMAEALVAWGSAAPVRFKYDDDLWDFEIVVRSADECNVYGCVLASAFFPDGGRHELTLYPQLFEQIRAEQVDTFTHEIGHVFGLRHFFAELQEEAWPSEIFGTHDKFSIMNYGELSRLTEADKTDLTRLYQLAWSGALKNINETPIKLVKPYSALSTTKAENANQLLAAQVANVPSPLAIKIPIPQNRTGHKGRAGETKRGPGHDIGT